MRAKVFFPELINKKWATKESKIISSNSTKKQEAEIIEYFSSFSDRDLRVFFFYYFFLSNFPLDPIKTYIGF